MKKEIFIICSVRGASPEYKKKLEDYTAKKEAEGYKVHLPHRDTNQEASGIDICSENALAIECADEIHIFYNKGSAGTHFDMGVAFGFGKSLTIVENEKFEEGKSFPRMLIEWEELK